MKLLFFITLLSSTLAFADAPSKEVADMARVLVANAQVVSQLQENGNIILKGYTVTETSPGVFDYTMTFGRQGLVIPSYGILQVTEDFTPTYVDGPIKYTATVTFSK